MGGRAEWRESRTPLMTLISKKRNQSASGISTNGCRVFIGEEPAIESRVRDNKRRYISSIRIDHITGYDGRHGSLHGLM
jgi:hypothetical protein